MTAATRGWGDPTTAAYRKKITSITVDGAKFNVHKDVAPIFEHFLNRLCTENNYSLDEIKDDWSYILRPIRGYEDEWESTRNFKYLSNHSWGLAIDVNATKNPMQRTLKTDMPVEWVRANVKAYKLQWGGDYSGRKDAMHFEFMGSPRDARGIVDRLKQTSSEDDELTADEKRQLAEVHAMLKALTAPRRTDRADVDPNAIAMADVYTLLEKTYTNTKA